jgi:hypothetical protein
LNYSHHLKRISTTFLRCVILYIAQVVYVWVLTLTLCKARTLNFLGNAKWNRNDLTRSMDSECKLKHLHSNYFIYHCMFSRFRAFDFVSAKRILIIVGWDEIFVSIHKISYFSFIASVSNTDNADDSDMWRSLVKFYRNG